MALANAGCFVNGSRTLCLIKKLLVYFVLFFLQFTYLLLQDCKGEPNGDGKMPRTRYNMVAENTISDIDP